MSSETIRSIGIGGPGASGGIDGLDAPAARGSGAAKPAGASDAPSFAETLGQALGAVERQQLEADGEVAKVAMGGGNLHEMSLALEKADISLRLATKVRNKLLDAYNEIMRMGV